MTKAREVQASWYAERAQQTGFWTGAEPSEEMGPVRSLAHEVAQSIDTEGQGTWQALLDCGDARYAIVQGRGNEILANGDLVVEGCEAALEAFAREGDGSVEYASAGLVEGARLLKLAAVETPCVLEAVPFGRAVVRRRLSAAVLVMLGVLAVAGRWAWQWYEEWSLVEVVAGPTHVEEVIREGADVVAFLKRCESTRRSAPPLPPMWVSTYVECHSVGSEVEEVAAWLKETEGVWFGRWRARSGANTAAARQLAIESFERWGTGTVLLATAFGGMAIEVPLKRWEGRQPSTVEFRELVGELASDRGDLAFSLENYMDVARETRDAGVAARAAKLAVFAQAEGEALEAARLWAEAAPSSVEARQVLASLLMRAGDVDGAVEHLEVVLQALSGPPGAGFQRASDLLSAEKDGEAAAAVMRRLALEHEDDAAAQLALARLLARTGPTEEALAVIDRAYELDPDNARIAVLRARLRHRADEVEGALSAMVKFLERMPDSGVARMAYARILVDAKRYDEARVQFEHLVAEEPDNDDARYALALLLVQTDRLDEAAQQFERLAARPSRRDVAHYYLGRIAESEERVDDAIASYRRVRRGEHRLNAQIRVAVLYAQSGDLAAARRHLHGVRSENSQEAVRIYRAEAGLLTRAERYEDAMAVFDASLAEFPGNPDLLYSRGMLAEKMDRLDICRARHA